MKHETDDLRQARRMVPLIQSIAREALDRTREVHRLEDEIETLSAQKGQPIREIQHVESELFLHRREIERVEKELERIGCYMDPDHPERIVCSIGGNLWTFKDRLEGTGYRQVRQGPKS